MRLTGIHRVPRADREVSITCGDSLCAFTSEKSESPKGDGFNESYVRARTESRFVVPRLFLPLRRDRRCLTLLGVSTSPLRMFGRSSRHSARMALTVWRPSTAAGVRRSSARSSAASSLKRRSVRLTSWDSLSRDGRCPNSATSSSKNESWSRSVSRPFARFSRAQRSSCVAQRPGKSATTPSFDLKKTDPALCEPTCGQRAYDLIRRVWSAGGSTATRAMLASHQQAETAACHLHAETWRASLAGILRHPRRQVVGIHSAQETGDRDSGCVETHAPTISAQATHPPDSGQPLSPWDTRSQAVVSKEQCPPDMDANQRFLVESDRVPIHTGEGVRHSKLELCGPRGNQQGVETIRGLQKPLRETKVIEPFWKRH